MRFRLPDPAVAFNNIITIISTKADLQIEFYCNLNLSNVIVAPKYECY